MEKFKSIDKKLVLKGICFFFVIFALPALTNETYRFFKKIGFEYINYFHAIDFLFIGSLVFAKLKKIDLSRFFKEKEIIFLAVFLILIRLSLLYSSGVNSYKGYSEALKFIVTASCFFFVFTETFKQKKELILNIFLKSVLVLALLNSVLAIAQFFLQKSIGLYFLGEVHNSIYTVGSPIIHVNGGTKWLFDQFHSSNELLRSYGLFFHPNILAGFLVMSIMLSLYLLQNTKQKLLFFFFIFLQFFALITTFSRAGLFAVFIAGSIWFSLMLLKKQNVSWSFLTYIIVVFVGLGLFSNQLYQRGGIVNYTSHNQSSDAVRIKQTSVALTMIKKEPFTGVGFKNFISRVKDFTNKPYLDNVHNIFLLAGAENGILALMAFLGFVLTLVIKTLRGSLNVLSITFLSVFISFLFIGMVDHYLFTREVGRLMFFSTTGFLAFSNQPFLSSQKV
ncbi:MAG: O-antigen ligase family protein [Chlamydiae bacterium]|nr:O-antigen ligase family protein [Chlamydiota bacterium]